MSNPKIKKVKSFPVNIFIAGDYQLAEKICQQYCDEIGYCVTVTPTNYVYKGGQEAGVIIGLINYPRFPVSRRDEIMKHAVNLGKLLRERLNQQSFSIQNSAHTIWYSWREQDLEYK